MCIREREREKRSRGRGCGMEVARENPGAWDDYRERKSLPFNGRAFRWIEFEGGVSLPEASGSSAKGPTNGGANMARHGEKFIEKDPIPQDAGLGERKFSVAQVRESVRGIGPFGKPANGEQVRCHLEPGSGM